MSRCIEDKYVELDTVVKWLEEIHEHGLAAVVKGRMNDIRLLMTATELKDAAIRIENIKGGW